MTCGAKSITLMAKSVRGAMAYMDKNRIFAVQKAHKLNSCILISNNLSQTRQSVRTGGFFYVGKFFGVGKRCSFLSASGVFPCLSEVVLYAEGWACLGGVVVVAVYGGTGIEMLQCIYQSAQRLSLLWCACVLGCVPVGCYSAYVADAYGACVVPLAVRPYAVDVAAAVYASVAVDDVVVAYGGESTLAVPACDVCHGVVAPLWGGRAVDDDVAHGSVRLAQ